MTTASSSQSHDRADEASARPGRPRHARRPAARQFAQTIADTARELLRGKMRAHVAGMRQISLAEFLADVEEPSCCFALEPREHGHDAAARVCVEISPRIAFAAISRLLGFSETPEPAPDRPLTNLERRLLERAVERLAEAIGRRFGSAEWLQLRCAGAEWQPQPPADLSCVVPGTKQEADVRMVVITLAVSLDRREGAIRLCLPGEFVRAAGRYRAGVLETPLEVSVTSPDMAVPADELANLSPGDVLAGDLPADTEAIVRVAGIGKFAARLSTVNGRLAVTITRKLC